MGLALQSSSHTKTDWQKLTQDTSLKKKNRFRWGATDTCDNVKYCKRRKRHRLVVSNTHWHSKHANQFSAFHQQTTFKTPLGTSIKRTRSTYVQRSYNASGKLQIAAVGSSSIIIIIIICIHSMPAKSVSQRDNIDSCKAARSRSTHCTLVIGKVVGKTHIVIIIIIRHRRTVRCQPVNTAARCFSNFSSVDLNTSRSSPS